MQCLKGFIEKYVGNRQAKNQLQELDVSFFHKGYPYNRSENEKNFRQNFFVNVKIGTYADEIFIYFFSTKTMDSAFKLFSDERLEFLKQYRPNYEKIFDDIGYRFNPDDMEVLSILDKFYLLHIRMNFVNFGYDIEIFN